MREWQVGEQDAALMVATGFARRTPDGALEMTDKGVQWTLDYLRKQDENA